MCITSCSSTSSSPDPFADKGDDQHPAGTEDYIHIRIQQRNGRKTLTTVQGISSQYDKKKLVKAFKKVGFSVSMLLYPVGLEDQVMACLTHMFIVLLLNRSLPATGP